MSDMDDLAPGESIPDSVGEWLRWGENDECRSGAVIDATVEEWLRSGKNDERKFGAVMTDDAGVDEVMV